MSAVSNPVGRPKIMQDRTKMYFYGDDSHRQQLSGVLSGLPISRSAWLRGAIESAQVEQRDGRKYVVSIVEIQD